MVLVTMINHADREYSSAETRLAKCYIAALRQKVAGGRYINAAAGGGFSSTSKQMIQRRSCLGALQHLEHKVASVIIGLVVRYLLVVPAKKKADQHSLLYPRQLRCPPAPDKSELWRQLLLPIEGGATQDRQ
jgi:hypothetical protein